MKIQTWREFCDDSVMRGLSLIQISNQAYGWHFQYLTVIGLTLSTLTFATALLADLTMSRRLFLAKNLLSVCSCPMEVLISVLYWGLRMVRRVAKPVKPESNQDLD